MSQLARPTGRQPDAWRTAAIGSVSFVALLWVIELVDQILDNRLDGGGIRPLRSDGLDGIVWAPLLHGGWSHLMSNTLPALVLCFVVMMSGLRAWAKATAIIWVVAGVGTWLTGGLFTDLNTVHIGASSLIFGWVVHLVLRGFFRRDATQILIGVVIFIVYGSMLMGVLPGNDGVSWQGHLFGALGGAVAAWIGDGWGRPSATPRAVKPPRGGRGTKQGPDDDFDIDALLRDLEK